MEHGRVIALRRPAAGPAAAAAGLLTAGSPGRAGGDSRPLALVKGAGDLATGVALRLTQAGYAVVMTETERPTVVRLGVALAEAIYAGRTSVQGLEAVRAGDPGLVPQLVAQGVVPVLVDPEARICESLGPDLLVDAIMAKRNLGTRIGDAPAVVALGPGFYAGRDVHAVVETMRGPGLGRVITRGAALPDTGIPAERGGFGRERVLRAPCAGTFVPLRGVGDRVETGEVVGFVDGRPVVSQLEGLVRGMLHECLEVTEGLKLGDIDPEATLADCYAVSDKALAIGDGVVRAAGLLGLRSAAQA